MNAYFSLQNISVRKKYIWGLKYKFSVFQNSVKNYSYVFLKLNIRVISTYFLVVRSFLLVKIMQLYSIYLEN